MVLLGTLAVLFAACVSGLPSAAGDGPILDPRQNIPIPPALSQFPSGLLNQFLRMISMLPQGAAALDAIGLILVPLQQQLADATGIDTTENDLARNAACADVTVVFARGTVEPGNAGLFVGPPFFDALKKKLAGRTLAVQGVDYPATFAGFNRNGTDGVPSMTKYLNQAITACPKTKVVMSGYSQGSLVVRSTAKSLPAGTMSKINSVITFGDPRGKSAIPGAVGKQLTICHPNDAVCSGGFITVDHLTYGEDANTAAQFVVQQAGA
ncbi:cutinase [Bimuria novae-zelandiae CBS 107.79]|uniref:Cutinase n=1 Tax=Bimuria novae-zelandiae CBS 107.79 TaxID=1447943 RepID=A0A6A5UZ16_9PLEO|nr:cutinase [Bimuria novae-zelandiae CBS 107.79]